MAIQTEELAKVKAHRWQISCLEFRGDGLMLATGSWDKEVRIWDLNNLEVVTILKGAHRVPITSVSWERPQGQLLCTGSADHTAVLWNTETGAQEETLAGHKGWVLDTSFSSTSAVLATASWDKTIGIWDVSTGKIISSYTTSRSEGVWSVDFHPHSPEILCSASEDGSVRMWDLREGKPTQDFTSSHSNAVVCAKWSPDGNTIASGSADTKICIWEVGTGLLLNTVYGHTDTVKSLAFNPNTDVLVPVLASAGDFTLQLSDPRPAQTTELLTLSPHTLGKEVEAVGISPDGSLVVSGGRDGLLVFLTLSIPSLRPQLSVDSSISEKLRNSQAILERSFDHDSMEDLHEAALQASTSEGDLSLAASREDMLMEASKTNPGHSSGSISKDTGMHRKAISARASRMKRTEKKVVDLPSMIAHLSATVRASMVEDPPSSSDSEEEERDAQKISALIGVAQKVNKYSEIAKTTLSAQDAGDKAPDPRLSLLPEHAPEKIREKRKYFQSKEASETTDGPGMESSHDCYNEYSGYSSLIADDSDGEDQYYSLHSPSKQRSFGEIGSEEEYYGDDIPFSMI